ncbi:DUF6069 family protein [Embleya sp. NPDC020630]|uniref:DUF6069 family protein n=1 Tax=Embleya sp. NPDC020630 TaxID=3363979 RepID=UPI0037B4B6AE
MTPTTDTRPIAGSLRDVHRARGLAVVGAVSASLAVWAVGDPLLGCDLVVRQKGQTRDLGAAAMGIFALVPALLGWALLAGLERMTELAGRIWTAAAMVLLAASLVPVFAVEAGGGTKTTLALAHVAVGAVLIPVFRKTAGTRLRLLGGAR